MTSVSLLSWNVAGRVGRRTEQADEIGRVAPDVICLQEVAPSTAGPWRDWLTEAGWPHVAVADTTAALAQGRRRPLAVLTATRRPLTPVFVDALPWPERVLSVRSDGLEIVNVHSPTSPKPHEAKLRTHRAVYAHLLGGDEPRLVCGDLNTPRREHPDGRVWTFARDQHGRLRRDRGEPWEAAELALIRGLEPHGFRDAYRELHGPEAQDATWERERWGGGHRLDHLIVSARLEVTELQYLHAWRHAGRSDHSLLYARFSVRQSG